MKVAVLFSGGKDSALSLLKAIEQGHQVKYLATIHSKNPDSFMYHTPNIGLTVFQSEAIGIDLVSKESKGEKGTETEDLKILLTGLDIEGVVCGAIESEYQKKRIEAVCKELGLQCICPLWQKNQEELLKEIISLGFEVIITAAAAEGFDKKWLGRKLNKKCIADLKKLNKKYKISLSGDGGCYETVTLDCPLFKRKIKLLKKEKLWDDKTNSGQLIIKDAKLVEKIK